MQVVEEKLERSTNCMPVDAREMAGVTRSFNAPLAALEPQRAFLLRCSILMWCRCSILQ